jgi:hypothetical protein
LHRAVATVGGGWESDRQVPLAALMLTLELVCAAVTTLFHELSVEPWEKNTVTHTQRWGETAERAQRERERERGKWKELASIFVFTFL